MYHLTKKDDINVEPTTVNEVTIDETTTNLSSTEIVNATSSSNVEVSALVTTSGDFEAKSNNIDEALKELGALYAKTPVDLNLKIDFTNTGNLSFTKVKANKLKIVFPDYIVFKAEEGIQGHELILDGQVLSEDGSSYSRTLKVEGYEFSKNPGSGEKPVDGTLTIVGEISMEGDVVTSGISGSGTLSLVPTAVLGEMTINSVNGVIQPNIKAETTNIELNDLPDFLKDEETRLDITNPVILLIAENPLATPVQIDAVLTPMKNNTQIEGKEVKIEEGYDKKPIELAPNKKNLIALSRTGECTIEGVTSNVKVEDINNLLETIPDDIVVDLQPVVRNEDYYTAKLGWSYEMPSSYEVDVPLSFEQGLNIVYNDSIQDLNKDLNDLDKVGLKNVKVILSVDNAIPLKLQLKAENVQIKDVYGNELSAVKKTIEEDKQYVAESTDGEKPATSELVLNLTSDDTAFLSKIDRICFKITAVTGSTTGVPLKDTQWLKITSIKLSVPGGVNVDLN